MSNSNPIAHNHYRTLSPELFIETRASASSAPRLVELNRRLLAQYDVDLDWFLSDQAISLFAGNWADSTNSPLAMAYAGHQFGSWVPLLGDGRAHMLGQINTANGLIDVQLKGSGQTAYSRGGDGRATLSSVLREYLVSEAMAGLSIPTTRSLAVVTTGDSVYREQPEPGAILVRTATSHIRVGTFQYAASRGGEQVKQLADFMLKKNFPQLINEPSCYLDLLNTCIVRQAELIAKWMLVGFIHGVMNTDNTSIVGETIDFGPCAFVDEFHPRKVFSSIDRYGRYAWENQAPIGLWNLTRFAETLLPLLDSDEQNAIAIAQQALESFTPMFDDAFYQGFELKLGLAQNSARHKSFVDETLALLAEHQIDFTVFFDLITHVATGSPTTLLVDLFDDPAPIEQWLDEWQQVKRKGAAVATRMRNANPALIARNHRVEEALNAATHDQDFGPFRRLANALANPYEVSEQDADLKTPPKVQERVTKTYCGT